MFAWLKGIVSGAGSFLGGLPWMHIALVAGVASFIAFGVHRVGISYKQEQQIQQDATDLKTEKQAHSNDVARANAEMHDMQAQYEKDLRIVAQQKDEALRQASDVSKQLEVIRYAKQSKTDGVAAGVLVDAFDWMLRQPDPYADPQSRNSQSTAAAAGDYASACHRVLYQSDVANFLIRQFQALDQCRGKLVALQKWNEN